MLRLPAVHTIILSRGLRARRIISILLLHPSFRPCWFPCAVDRHGEEMLELRPQWPQLEDLRRAPRPRERWRRWAEAVRGAAAGGRCASQEELQHGVPLVVGVGLLRGGRGRGCRRVQLLVVGVLVVVAGLCGGGPGEDGPRLPLRRTHGQGSGEEERGSMDGGRAPEVPGRAGEAGERRLARHLPALRHHTHADAGGQPRPEVLPPAGRPRAEEAAVQPLRRGREKWRASPQAKARRRQLGGRDGVNIPCSFPGRQPAEAGSDATAVPDSDAELLVAVVVGEPRTEAPSFPGPGGKCESSSPAGARPGAEDLVDGRPEDRAAGRRRRRFLAVAEDALFGNHQGHLGHAKDHPTDATAEKRSFRRQTTKSNNKKMKELLLGACHINSMPAPVCVRASLALTTKCHRRSLRNHPVLSSSSSSSSSSSRDPTKQLYWPNLAMQINKERAILSYRPPYHRHLYVDTKATSGSCL